MKKHFSFASVGTMMAALLITCILGCGGSQEQQTTQPPPPPPQQTAPPVVHQHQQAPPPQTQPTYQPTTEQWVPLPIRITYPSGGSRLDDNARAMLREAHASVAHRTDIIRVRVEGHADGQGSTQQNHALGLERAQGVIDFLVGDLGMPREFFEFESHGDTRPLTSETTAGDRVQNRRVEFSILVRRQAAQ